ncbi:MAG TPA: helix-turn-helix domain-containing protein [Solirubrobacterales bacterium]|jgi:DNA-binding PucR family transcriptional regulator|nr:helix-turn-helix domain-containing protein [Solirubrobacterales bacterium]HEX2467388.1 helix-turn-helix domain-containing protein [Solirubrobacterales bacterium]
MATRTSAKPAANRSETASSVALRKLASRLAADDQWVGAVADEITAAIHQQLPELEADEGMREATYASSESNVRMFIDVVRMGTDPDEAEPPPPAIDYARQFVRQGLTIDALLRAYHIGQAAFVRNLSSTVRSAVEDPLELPAALEQATGLTLAYVNAVNRALVKQYARERDRWVRSAAAVRADVVSALLGGGQVDRETAERRLGYPLGGSHLAFVVWCPAGGEDVDDLGALERAASGLAADLGGSHRLLVPLGAQLIAGWVGRYEERVGDDPLRRTFDVGSSPEACAATGLPGPELDGFARSHREAMHARRIAGLIHRPPGSVVAYQDVALPALASADLEHARDFVLRHLGPLAAEDDDSLRLSATLRVYLEERSSPRRTAERLGVHANTITNRIRAAQELLDHPIESRVAELLVALRLAAVVRDER